MYLVQIQSGLVRDSVHVRSLHEDGRWERIARARASRSVRRLVDPLGTGEVWGSLGGLFLLRVPGSFVVDERFEVWRPKRPKIRVLCLGHLSRCRNGLEILDSTFSEGFGMHLKDRGHLEPSTVC